jgi:hypothetical protein
LGLDGGDSFWSSCCLSTNNLSVLFGKNSGAVVAKKISFFEEINCSLGIDIVWTRFPLTMSLISMELDVKAIT